MAVVRVIDRRSGEVAAEFPYEEGDLDAEAAASAQAMWFVLDAERQPRTPVQCDRCGKEKVIEAEVNTPLWVCGSCLADESG